MKIDLTGRKAVVTGSTAGIGRATAEGLAGAGAAVVVSGRTAARVDEAVRQMQEAFPGSEISGIAADLATAEGASLHFARALDADILVNNLGTAYLRNFADIADDDWLSLFQLNVMSGVRMTRHYLPGMVSRGWGRVVFVSSESAVNIPREMIDYGMTKAAQLAISRGVASQTIDEIVLFLGQGDLVFLAARGTHVGGPCAYIDLYRVERGKLVEHWGFPQEMRRGEDGRNGNGIAVT